MQVKDFDFDLPPDSIALRPVRPRDAARLLIIRPNDRPALVDERIPALLNEVRPGDAIVFNNTQVIPARLVGRRILRGAGEPKIEVTLLKREASGTWQAFARPAKKLCSGDHLLFEAGGSHGGTLKAQIREKRSLGEICLSFETAKEEIDAALANTGTMPLPPYIAQRRAPDGQDFEDYQTVYADRAGAVAAPTAGLHFTPQLLSALESKKVALHYVTLHVGAGTFLPVKVDNILDHKMHHEAGELSEETANALNNVKARGGRIIAVGTTSLRLLESATGEDGRISPFQGETDIFITPGYRFKAADMVLTNFHLPKSTLFMLVSAFSGLAQMKQAYAHAITAGYRFYSYGDACLLYPERAKS